MPVTDDNPSGGAAKAVVIGLCVLTVLSICGLIYMYETAEEVLDNNTDPVVEEVTMDVLAPSYVDAYIVTTPPVAEEIPSVSLDELVADEHPDVIIEVIKKADE